MTVVKLRKHVVLVVYLPTNNDATRVELGFEHNARSEVIRCDTKYG